MYLKQLVIQGFKSFPDKTVVGFGHDITAIVGPNGSGKSNISDAIRWVMGEQNSRSLRGQKMEDVIFGGTEKRAPVGFAEATLVLDNSDRALHYDADELMVTRRYYRSGESEYYINKQSVRLRDVNELFMDTGLGRDGYSNISQGRIDEILSLKSTDRREIFEEAAGISKYRHRKEETERRLATTQDNLTRIGDKISELELQVGPLRDQAEKAKRYLTYREELKGLEVALWLQSLERLSATARKAEEDYHSAAFILQQEHDALDKLYVTSESLTFDLHNRDLQTDQIRDAIRQAEAASQEQRSRIAVLETNRGNAQSSARRDKLRAEDFFLRVHGGSAFLYQISIWICILCAGYHIPPDLSSPSCKKRGSFRTKPPHVIPDLSDEMRRNAGFLLRKAELFLSKRDAAHQEGHVAGQNAHGLQALAVLLCLPCRAAVDAVPVLAGGHRHAGDREIFIQLIERRGAAAAAGAGPAGADLHRLIKRSAVKQAIKAGDKRRIGRRIVDGAWHCQSFYLCK